MKSDMVRESLLMKHGATSRNFKKIRGTRPWCASLEHTFSDRAILVYKPPLERQYASSGGRSFFLFCDSVMLISGLKGNVRMCDFVDFKNLLGGQLDQKSFDLLYKYYHIDERMFELAKKNPFVKFMLAPDWHLMSKEFGDDFTKDEEKFVPMCERIARGEEV